MNLDKIKKKRVKNVKEFLISIKKWREAIEINEDVIPTLSMLYNNLGINASQIYRIKIFNRIKDKDTITNKLLYLLKEYTTLTLHYYTTNYTYIHNNTLLDSINTYLHQHNLHIGGKNIYFNDKRNISINIEFFLNSDLVIEEMESLIQELTGIYDFRILNGKADKKYISNYAIKYREYLAKREDLIMRDNSIEKEETRENKAKTIEIEFVGVNIPQEQKTSK